ncbi:hypothetical protein Bca52824_065891 [Brassica carinata]|uniref:ATPase AAA-type core domain-containing protein n=1 Tax=Brassica carinata TaxID=52824 RepID=A0A8X7UBF9_BRACI|nr:hypothetical protein Bca52824_065891 [Brassica carinata]
MAWYSYIFHALEDISRKPSHSLKNIAKDEFERNFVSALVAHGEIGVKFDDIGSLEHVKKTLNERAKAYCYLVLLVLVRRFAKALATEAGANFISITSSSLTSKWFGDAEKLTKDLFSFASKLVDSLLDACGGSSEHESTRMMRNEFMTAWDGFRSKDSQRILILGATSRPFDLDRLPRRLAQSLREMVECSARHQKVGEKPLMHVSTFVQVLMWMSSKLLLNFNGLLNLLTTLIQLWNIDDCYIVMGRDTYIYYWYRQRNKCHGWTSGYGRLSSNAKPSLNAENWPLVIVVSVRF